MTHSCKLTGLPHMTFRTCSFPGRSDTWHVNRMVPPDCFGLQTVFSFPVLLSPLLTHPTTLSTFFAYACSDLSAHPSDISTFVMVIWIAVMNNGEKSLYSL